MLTVDRSEFWDVRCSHATVSHFD